MIAVDRTPQIRGRGDATAADGIVLGLGQAAALAPGVSRNGATLVVARARGSPIVIVAWSSAPARKPWFGLSLSSTPSR